MLIQEFLYLLKDERMNQLKDIQSVSCDFWLSVDSIVATASTAFRNHFVKLLYIALLAQYNNNLKNWSLGVTS